MVYILMLLLNGYNLYDGEMVVVLIIFILSGAGMVKLENLIAPNEAARSDLLMVHTEKYLNSLKVCFQLHAEIASNCLRIGKRHINDSSIHHIP